MTVYEYVKEKRQTAFNEFMENYGFSAFNDDQINDGLTKLNCKPEDLFNGGGGFYYLKTAAKKLHNLIDDKIFENEYLKFNYEYMYDLFYYSMFNYEFQFNRDIVYLFYHEGLINEFYDHEKAIKQIEELTTNIEPLRQAYIDAKNDFFYYVNKHDMY